jgi:PilZ domain
MEQERRAPRYPFAAPAEVIVESSGAKTIARVTELSLHGCYLDACLPVSAKTSVLVKIFGPHGYFEAGATVVYAHPVLGLGLAFRSVKPDFVHVLQKWLLAAMQPKEPERTD